MVNVFPKTGRIGRFVKILGKDAASDAALAILAGAEQYASLSAAEKSAWWNGAVGRMEHRLGRETAIGIMRTCGSKCCGKGQRATAKRLFRESGTLEAFLDRISTHDVKKRGPYLYA